MSELITDIKQLQPLLESQRASFSQSPYPDYQSRVAALKALKQLLLDNQEAFVTALNQDFGSRSEDDSRIGDILTSVMGINYTLSRLKKWMKPEKKHVGILFQPAKAEVLYQPMGVVGIIVPWNYPLFLSIGPLTTAIAAGNRAMLKMSEATPATNVLLAKLIGLYFSQDQIAVVGGEADVAAAFSQLAFDHLFYTGSGNVGQLVLKAAAQNMVPVTLELGGKSPAIIDESMAVETAVDRFILGKTLNAGQTCVAPDYIYCHQSQLETLQATLSDRFKALYPSVEDNPDYTSIVNDRQYQRIQGLLDDAQQKGAQIISLGADAGCKKLRKMPLTLVLNATDDMQIMREEIFGPLLPILTYENIDQVIKYVNDRPRPLALYVYSYNKAFQAKVLQNTHSGGACINEAAFHVVNEDLPFGGVGASGMGNYHGKEGFITFSHAKSILSKGRISLTSLLFPPFGKPLHKLIYKLFIR